VSSSNLVRITFIEESTLGTTPGAGNFSTARFISESLSGTPGTTESQQIRSDRMSSGQVVTSLEVGGEMNFELARDTDFDKLLAGVMLSTWDTQVATTVDLDIEADDKTITRASGDFNSSVDVGDFIITTGFADAANNTVFQVLEIVSATVVRVSMPAGVVTEEGTGTTFKRADRLSIGTTKKSFSMEKAFLDLTNKAINYRGMLPNTFSLQAAYGEIVNGSFGFSGTDYDPVEASADFMTDGRTISAAATSNSMNGSIDMPMLNSSSSGDFEDVTFCIQSVGIELNNNYQPQNCIGQIAPENYSAGQASINIDLNAYLANENWSLLANKLSQDAFSLGFVLKNSGGWYGFYLPAVQVSFDDPSSGGANQEISLEMSGTAKVGPAGESAIYIYRS
jgi:hypothetical protein